MNNWVIEKSLETLPKIVRACNSVRVSRKTYHLFVNAKRPKKWTKKRGKEAKLPDTERIIFTW